MLATFFRKKWRKKFSADEKSPENAGSFIEGIELVRQLADSNSNSFPIRLRRIGHGRPVIFRVGDFSKAAKRTVVLLPFCSQSKLNC
jgi:hypothetical protein